MICSLLPRFAAAMAFTLILAAPLPWAGKARAAGLAQDHTVLYYLVEMQRRSKRTCDGQPMPDAPSLMPSEPLRGLARASAATGRPIQAPDGSAVFTASTFGGTPQQAVNALVANQCRELMGANLHYIGAFSDNGNWTIAMSATDPGQWAAGPAAEPGAETVPAHPGEGFQDSGAAVQASPVIPERPQAGTAPLSEASQGAQDGRSAGGEPTAPAAPVAVGEMALDYRGQPVGSLLPLSDPSQAGARQGTGQSDSFPSGLPPSQPDVSGGQGNHPQPQAQSRLGVTPLYDERQAPVAGGIGTFAADASGSAPPAPTQPALVPQPGTPPRPGQGWSSPLTTQQAAGAEQGRLVPQVPANQPDQTARQRPSTMPVQAARPSDAGKGDPTAMLALINSVRAKGFSCAGTPMPPAPALTAHPVLASSAQAHAEDMAARRYFSSTTPEGRTLGRRLSNAGYEWGFVAENIAGGSGSLEKILQSWLDDGKQCQNLMSPQYTQAGVGYAPSGKLWVFSVAAPMQSGAIKMR